MSVIIVLIVVIIIKFFVIYQFIFKSSNALASYQITI